MNRRNLFGFLAGAAAAPFVKSGPARGLWPSRFVPIAGARVIGTAGMVIGSAPLAGGAIAATGLMSVPGDPISIPSQVVHLGNGLYRVSPCDGSWCEVE